MCQQKWLKRPPAAAKTATWQGTQELGQDAAKGRCYKGREGGEAGEVRSHVVLTTSGQVTQREKSRQGKHEQERKRESERGRA